MPVCAALESAVDDELLGAIAIPLPLLEAGSIAVAFTGPLLNDERACLLPPPGLSEVFDDVFTAEEAVARAA